jgi:hypothetical protein
MTPRHARSSQPPHYEHRREQKKHRWAAREEAAYFRTTLAKFQRYAHLNRAWRKGKVEGFRTNQQLRRVVLRFLLLS